KTFGIILSGDNFDGKEAERIGFVNKAVPEDELEKETDAFVNRFLGHNGPALRQARQVIYRNLDMTFDKAIKIVWADLEKSLTSDIVIEGFTAAMEKRKPVWKK
ncbi:MAG: enoyl-CoA hydratase-related protein, partial [Thermodesulfobacteriota bacterium]|nr:enoyl-CoA hydratase-related protein [Thermodesulfobacteriota bacterium]